MIPELELNKSTSTLGFNIQLTPSWEREGERESTYETHLQNQHLRLTERERQPEILSFQSSSDYLPASKSFPLFSFTPLFLKEPN